MKKKITTHDIVKKKLEAHPDFRERRHRSKYLAILALRKEGLEHRWQQDEPFRIDQLADFAVAFDTYRHAWTDVTRDHEELRGRDYDDKEKLEQDKMLELGYVPMHDQDVKQLKKL